MVDTAARMIVEELNRLTEGGPTPCAGFCRANNLLCLRLMRRLDFLKFWFI